MNPLGTIFKIERLAIHDGPGIRTVIFFKGCPLRCSWCSSPESQRSRSELVVDRHTCLGCLDCARVCPQQAIAVLDGGSPELNRELCDACGECVRVCQGHALAVIGRTVHVSEVLDEIEKDEIFYHRSGGGITLSGGEPAHQPEFAGRILEGARYRGLHTAMETCGFASREVIAGLTPLLDLVYVDLKHMEAGRHRAVTGQDNACILQAIADIDEHHPETELIVRIPVVPGVNDDEDNVNRSVDFLRRLQRLTRVELLPYHRYGTRTYGLLGRSYALAGTRPPSLERMQELADRFASSGLPAVVGG